MASNFKSILIIKPSSLGDIVLALPALSALRKSFPDANISWLIRPEFAPLLKNHPHLTDIIPFDRKFLAKAWINRRALSALLLLIRRLRRSKFDAVIDLQGLFRTACLAWLTGCKKRFGMTTAREFAHIFYTHKVPQTQDCIHVVDYYLKIVRTAVAFSSCDKRNTQYAMRNTKHSVQFVLPQDPTAVKSVNKLLQTCDIKPGSYAVFIPGSAHKDKCWPVERFATLADKISSQFGLSVIATGTAPEKNIVERLKRLANVPIADLAGRTSLSELIALLKAAKLVVSNDTGPGHIAAAVGMPLVMIFGPSNPIRLFPYRRPETLAAVEPFERGLKLQSTNTAHAIEAITVDYVFEKVCEQLKKI